MFNSYKKENFVVGKEYYTYYMDVTNKGNKLQDCTGIMRVVVTSNDISERTGSRWTKFDILECGKMSKRITKNIHTYMNGYGSAYTKFFKSYD